jgi:hypothetical protein
MIQLLHPQKSVILQRKFTQEIAMNGDFGFPKFLVEGQNLSDYKNDISDSLDFRFHVREYRN